MPHAHEIRLCCRSAGAIRSRARPRGCRDNRRIVGLPRQALLEQIDLDTPVAQRLFHRRRSHGQFKEAGLGDKTLELARHSLSTRTSPVGVQEWRRHQPGLQPSMDGGPLKRPPPPLHCGGAGQALQAPVATAFSQEPLSAQTAAPMPTASSARIITQSDRDTHTPAFRVCCHHKT